jgi:hypothetical protein
MVFAARILVSGADTMVLATHIMVSVAYIMVQAASRMVSVANPIVSATHIMGSATNTMVRMADLMVPAVAGTGGQALGGGKSAVHPVFSPLLINFSSKTFTYPTWLTPG